MGQNLLATATSRLTPTSYASKERTINNINYEYNDKVKLYIGVIPFTALYALIF